MADANSSRFPPGLTNAYLFAIFNAMSFQLVLSSPMVLYAKTLGASATVLGIISGMTPLLVIFQMPAAYFIPRVGYRRFVYGGWGMRGVFIFIIAVVPVMSLFFSAGTRLAFVLILSFRVNLLRRIFMA